MLAVLYLVLGIYTCVFANVCKDIKPLDNFSLEKNSGDWHISSLKISNLADQTRYKGMSCVTGNFGIDAENKPSNWTADFLLGGVAISLGGKYTIPDPTKGLLKAEFTPLSITYDVVIKCTDYATYCIAYFCVQVKPAESSEFLILLTKDPMKFDEVIASSEVKKCFADISSKPIEEELQKIPSDNCPNVHKN